MQFAVILTSFNKRQATDVSDADVAALALRAGVVEK
jgi:hypothetical protein